MEEENILATNPARISWFESNPKKTLLIMWLIFVIIIEFLLRLFSPPHLLDKKHIVANELYFKNYVSSIEFVTYPSEFDNFKPVINKINSIGVRGPELQKKIGYRVLNIGDSFVQADEVSFESTFGEKLNNSNLDIEFISHGIEGWSPTPEFSWIYHNVDHVKYDEVNLFLCINDFFRKSDYLSIDEVYRTYANYSDNGIPISYNIASPEKTIRDIAREFYIYKLMSFAKSKIRSASNKNGIRKDNINVPDEIIMLSYSSEVWDDELRINVLQTLDVVRKMAVFLENKNIKLNVLFVPLGLAWEDEFTAGKQSLSSDWEKTKIISQEGIEKFTREFLQNHEINYIELSEEFHSFKNENKNVSLFYQMDGHWNQNGHFLVHKILNNHYETMKTGP